MQKTPLIYRSHFIAQQSQPDNVLVCDVHLIRPSDATISWSELEYEWETAQAIFKEHGVHLNLISAREVTIPPEWHRIYGHELPKHPDEKQGNFYEGLRQQPKIIPQDSINIFRSLLSGYPNVDKALFCISLNEVVYPYWEQDQNGVFQEKEISVSGLSFPPYFYSGTIPRDIRGIITLNASKADGAILAHELGHKLINVSHEGLDQGPRFSGNGVPGLMGYGTETEIHGGEKGRWHQERLLRSPFLYRYKQGQKYWNPDFQDGGKYNDRIYGEFSLIDP